MIALWCGLLQRLLQTGGILREASEALVVIPALTNALAPIITLAIGLTWAYWAAVTLYLTAAGAVGPHHADATDAEIDARVADVGELRRAEIADADVSAPSALFGVGGSRVPLLLLLHTVVTLWTVELVHLDQALIMIQSPSDGVLMTF